MQIILYSILLTSSIMANITQNNKADIVYLFSHGLADSHKQAFRYKDLTAAHHIETFDYPDVHHGILRVNRLAKQPCARK